MTIFYAILLKGAIRLKISKMLIPRELTMSNENMIKYFEHYDEQ